MQALDPMETIQYHPLLQITEDVVKRVRQFYGVDDEKRIRDSLEAIGSWFKKQEHLADAYQQLRECDKISLRITTSILALFRYFQVQYNTR